MHQEFDMEQERLKTVLDYLIVKQEETLAHKKAIDEDVSYSLKHYNSDNTEQYIELIKNTGIQSSLMQRVSGMARAVKKPYFARVDFIPEDTKKQERYYIGKMSLIRDEDLSPLIIDWRAPVSILYYEERIGQASYRSPDGIISGEISLKRQYIIEDAKLLDMFDIDITTNDEFLQAALGSVKDNRLKDIVTTIQAEQNRVIRARLDKPLIVQGAAGGGKTTIALHRIAYLLYNYEDILAPKNIMIIAPNRFFLSYISEVLPELGVESVKQTTFDDFAREFTECPLNTHDPSLKLKYILSHPEHAELLKRQSGLKGSLAFRSLIDNFITETIKTLFPPEDFCVAGYVLYSRKKIMKHLLEDYTYLPVAKRLTEIKKYLVGTIKERRPVILSEIELQYDKKADAVKAEMPDSEERRGLLIEIYDERDAMLKLIKDRSRTAVAGYFKQAALLTADKYYVKLFEGDNLRKAGRYVFPPQDLSVLKQLATNTIARPEPTFEIEDLAPIMHIHNIFYGKGDHELKHVVIDEAQDLSLFQLFVLKEIMGTPSFSILGDLYQGIYSYRGISDWQTIDNLFEGKANRFTLEQSYRTTVEVMDFANHTARMMKDIHEPLAKPVIRHGKPVTVRRINSVDDIILTANEMKNRGMCSIAVICKTIEACKSLHGQLAGFSLIAERDENYEGGMVIVPSYLAKGLEFDCVIIADASRDIYTESAMDCKLLYVALTRSLHELAVFYQGEPSVLLASGNTN